MYRKIITTNKALQFTHLLTKKNKNKRKKLSILM